MTKIEAYSFGSITVNGMTIQSDLIIFPDGTVKQNWWRRQGHHLIFSDISDLLDAVLDTLVIGTGDSGRMSLSDDLLKECQARGIEVRAMPTADAVDEYNRSLKADGKVGACFHLTC